MMIYRIGTLVLYHSRTAYIRNINGDKLEIAIEGGGSKNVREKDLVFLHPGPVNSLPPQKLPDPDLADVAALMEGEKLSFSDFMDLLYGKTTPDAAYSAYLLLAADLYFEGSVAEGVTLKDPAEVEKKLAVLREKEEAKAKYEARVERIRTRSILEEDLPYLNEIGLVAKKINSASRLMKDAGIEATPEKAQRLLLDLGVWTWRDNPIPARFGVELSNPEIPEMNTLPDENRVDLTQLAAYAIDDEGSNDPDDAISYDAETGMLWVHVADPAVFAEPGSAIDHEACRRGANLYLPEGVTHMLPLWMTDVFGLGLNETSPALSFAIRIDPETGEAELEQVCLSTVKVERHTYDTAANLPLDEVRALLERFRRKRAENGALFIDLPEVKIHTDEAGVVSIRRIGVTPERELVANAMLAAGSAVAKWAVANNIPMPFVVQDPPDPALMPPPDADLDSMPRMYAMRKACQTGITSTSPGCHAGLGLDPYTRVTSPLRRYCDLLAHQQIRRFLAGDELMDSAEMEDALAVSEAASGILRRVERLCNEYWTLVWLLQQQESGEWHTEAIPVYHPDDRWFFLLPELAYEYKCRFGGRVRMGEPVTMFLQKADPVMLMSRMRIRIGTDDFAEAESLEDDQKNEDDNINTGEEK